MTTLAPRRTGSGRGRSPSRNATGPATREALVVWTASRVAVAVVAAAAAWVVAAPVAGGVPSFLDRWNRWDADLYVKIARWGYGGYPLHYPDRGAAAFFPGEPLLLRVVHLAVPSWTGSGLVLSAVAGAVAAVALAGIARLEAPAAGGRAVAYLVVSPFAVFLAAGYSEALFLAFALPSWLAARRGRWAVAGLLAGGAAVVRVTGVFLAVALAVEYLRARRGRPRADVAWLAVPWLVTFGYFAYLHARTGDWLAWQHAQQAGWGRSFTDPVHAFSVSWRSALSSGLGPDYTWSFRAEVAALAVGVALTAVLLWRRRWAESSYVGLQVLAFATSSYYLSIARASLLWWPLWTMLAAASLRRRWVHVAYLSVAPALCATYLVAFTEGHWVG